MDTKHSLNNYVPIINTLDDINKEQLDLEYYAIESPSRIGIIINTNLNIIDKDKIYMPPPVIL
jgi:hypothetical protein